MAKMEKDKKRILSHANINTCLALTAFMMALASLPFEKNHVLYSLSHGDVTYNKSEETGFESVTSPINIKIQNLSDGPIKVVETFIGFDMDGNGSCEQWMRTGPAFPTENNGFIEKGGLANHEDLIVVPVDRKEAEICLYSAWRNQNGYQRIYLQSVGHLKWQVAPSSNDRVSVFQRKQIGLRDIINVFGPSHCMSLLSEEFCL